MWQTLFVVLPLLMTASGIKVPIDRSAEIVEDEVPVRDNPTQIAPTYYVTDDANIDTYLIPPNQHHTEDILPDVFVTPATYLLPPAVGNQPDFYFNPAEPGDQSEWYPIPQSNPAQQVAQLQTSYQNYNQSDILPIDNRKSKSYETNVRVPATGLEPPLEGARNEYFAPTSAGIVLDEIPRPINREHLIPLEELQHPIHVPKLAKHELQLPKKHAQLNYRPKPTQPALALHLIPPQPEDYKIPTKLYPKKFSGEFKPVPLPLAQYADDSALDVPRAKPAKLFKPLPSTEIDYLTPTDEKINYLYRKAENKRKLKGEQLSQDSPPEASVEETYSRYSKPESTEQDASESNYGHSERNSYPAPQRQPQPQPAAASHHDGSSANAPDERTEFRMHGMKGPHSYQFGFDTGKGKNRQFRYEERDNDGQVRGHYGYMDRHGKLRVVNYSADPKTGFRAEAPVDKE